MMRKSQSSEHACQCRNEPRNSRNHLLQQPSRKSAEASNSSRRKMSWSRLDMSNLKYAAYISANLRSKERCLEMRALLPTMGHQPARPKNQDRQFMIRVPLNLHRPSLRLQPRLDQAPPCQAYSTPPAKEIASTCKEGQAE